MVDKINGNFFQQHQQSKPQEAPKFGLADTDNLMNLLANNSLTNAAGIKPLKTNGNLFDGYFR